jgi:hypothetical protein
MYTSINLRRMLAQSLGSIYIESSVSQNAAAFAYDLVGKHNSSERTILVFDLGGGTLGATPHESGQWSCGGAVKLWR